MLTAEEYRVEAEACLKLASETDQAYARAALLELAEKYLDMAEQLVTDQPRLKGGAWSPVHYYP